MLQDIVICTLSAAGVLLLIWLLIGHFVLPLDALECCVVLSAHGDAEHLPQQLRACRYLQESGVLRGRLIVADYGMTELGKKQLLLLQQDHQEVEICTAAQLPEVLEKGQ